MGVEIGTTISAGIARLEVGARQKFEAASAYTGVARPGGNQPGIDVLRLAKAG
ncbi:hypothetical protein [Rhizobium sp. 2YAF20]|uniref:hypothetical protein n=1 Tax=Rhizobium sp. 2YAF20 TaxID=3233027 RepID=UPI003F9A63E7